MKKAILFTLFALTLFASCKKDKDEEEVTLVGKWTVQNIIFKEFDNNVMVDTETEPGGGATIDFQSNGNVVITNPTGSETYPYTISGSAVTFDGGTYQIRDLGRNNATLYVKEDAGTGAGDYYEFFINLTR